MQQIFIHADDFGNTKNISKSIYKCYKKGNLNSTSIIVNTLFFKKSIKLIKNEPIRKVLHLNIMEGKSISPNLTFLTNKKGEFFRSWQRVVFEYYCLYDQKKKSLIKQDIKEEYKNQIKLYCTAMETKSILIDSHQHTHEIPFITDILIELIAEMDISVENIRVTKEKLFWAFESYNDLKNYFGINFLVHFLLNYLSNKMIKKFDSLNIPYNEAFIGVLFSGDMTLTAIQKGLEKSKDAKTVEVLLHPGYISEEEQLMFKNNQFKKWYMSKNRKKEMNVLLSNVDCGN